MFLLEILKCSLAYLAYGGERKPIPLNNFESSITLGFVSGTFYSYLHSPSLRTIIHVIALYAVKLVYFKPRHMVSVCVGQETKKHTKQTTYKFIITRMMAILFNLHQLLQRPWISVLVVIPATVFFRILEI